MDSIWVSSSVASDFTSPPCATLTKKSCRRPFASTSAHLGDAGVSLAPAAASAMTFASSGVAAATSLPSGEGSIQNAGYALQWWVFAAFAAFMTLRFVRTIGRDGKLGTLAAEEEA